MDCFESCVPARLHPARAAAIVAAPRRVTMADFIDISRLVDVHHEYPGETFLIIDDTPPANGGIASEDDILAAVSAYVAFGIVPSKVVIFRHSAVPEANQLLWRTRALVTPRRRFGRTDDIFTTRALLFAATCLAIRATTIAAHDSDAAACAHARTIAASFNAGRQESVLAEPTIRRLDVMDDPVDVAAARAVSPFDSRTSIEEGLLAFLERRDRLLRRPDDLRGLLREGARLARDEASATLAAMYAT